MWKYRYKYKKFGVLLICAIRGKHAEALFFLKKGHCSKCSDLVSRISAEFM